MCCQIKKVENNCLKVQKIIPSNEKALKFIFDRYPTEECPSAAILMSIQSIVGVIIQAWMAGIIFAKFTIPRNRGQTIYFSKNAVISLRNGVLQLMCRITDLRKYSLLDARVMVRSSGSSQKKKLYLTSILQSSCLKIFTFFTRFIYEEI
jgi:hypothetical protein